VAVTHRPSLVGAALAFLRMGIQATISYPMSFVLSQLRTVLVVVTAFFLAHIVLIGPIVGGHYLAFAAVGIAAQTLVMGPLRGAGQELDATIQQGRFEMLLIEPIRWPLIPVGLALWPSALSVIQLVVTLGIAAALGVRLLPTGFLLALPLAVLATLSGLAISLLAASVRVLAKRSDPIWVLYELLSGLVGGVTVPINVLPAPLRALSWLTPTMYVGSGLRKLLLPHAATIYGPSGLGATVVLAASVVPLAVIVAIVFNRSINAGRRLGVLAGY